VRGVLLDLADLLKVVVGDQRLVLVQLLERLGGLDGVGVDDLVPDPCLALAGGEVLDVLVDDEKLRHAGHVETGAHLVERLDDGGVGVGLDGVIGLDARQVLLELEVVGPQDLVVHHKQRRAVLLGQPLQKPQVRHFVFPRIET
jgi:hypothetical protein